MISPSLMSPVCIHLFFSFFCVSFSQLLIFRVQTEGERERERETEGKKERDGMEREKYFYTYCKKGEGLAP